MLHDPRVCAEGLRSAKIGRGRMRADDRGAARRVDRNHAGYEAIRQRRRPRWSRSTTSTSRRARRIPLHRRPERCGKSTLLRILAGLEHQTGGTVAVDAAGWAVENAMVFQDSGLFPWMKVETNVGFGLMTRGVPAAGAPRVEAALKLVGLTSSAAIIRISSPAACASAAPSPAPSSPIRRCS